MPVPETSSHPVPYFWELSSVLAPGPDCSCFHWKFSFVLFACANDNGLPYILLSPGGESALIRFLSILLNAFYLWRISLMLPACPRLLGFSWVPYIPWWTAFLGSMLSLLDSESECPFIHPSTLLSTHCWTLQWLTNPSTHSATHPSSIYPSIHPGVPTVCQPSCSLTMPFRDDIAPVRLCFLPVLMTRSLIWLHWVDPGVVIFLVIRPFQLLCPVVLYWNSHLPSRQISNQFLFFFMILITVMKIHSFTFLINYY